MEDYYAKCIKLKRISKEIYAWNKKNGDQPCRFTQQDEITFARTAKCYSKQRISGKYKVKEHDHWNGKHRGASCVKCSAALRSL